MNWTNFFQGALGVAQWTVAIAAVLGTVALFAWIVIMIAKRDK